MLLKNVTLDSVTVKQIRHYDAFDLAQLDWFAMSREDRENIIKTACYIENFDDFSQLICSAVIVIPRPNKSLDIDNCYLHISTLGKIDLDDMGDFIINKLKCRFSQLENPVVLSPLEKILILGNVIPSKDMREVI